MKLIRLSNIIVSINLGFSDSSTIREVMKENDQEMATCVHTVAQFDIPFLLHVTSKTATGPFPHSGFR